MSFVRTGDQSIGARAVSATAADARRPIARMQKVFEIWLFMWG
jgi:hypothetical protein